MQQVVLNGEWELSSPQLPGRKIPAELPGDMYSALLKAGIIPDPYFGCNETAVQQYRDYEWEFRRCFDLPESVAACEAVLLNLEMADTFCTVFLNGRKAVSTENMFARYRTDVRKLLKPGRNEIVLKFRPVEPEAAKIAASLPSEVPMNDCAKVKYLNLVRKVQCHGGWDWGITLAVSGVYEPITLTGVNEALVDCCHTTQAHGKNRVDVTAHAELFAVRDGRATVKFRFNGEEREVRTTLRRGVNLVKCGFTVKNPRLWWPNGYGEQTLYPLTVSAADGGKTVEIGLRTLEVVNEKDAYGTSMTFRINGVDVFCKGADWIPADAFPSRQTPERYENLLESARLANMNMVRAWGGGQYEHELFYELCDRKGLLVWQDMMFACSLYPATEEFIAGVRSELEFQIRRLRHHACIALWCGDNEVIGATGWYGAEKRTGYLIQYDRLNREIARTVTALDPDRVFWPSSPCGGPGNFGDGWHDDSCGDMHYWEVWHGGKDFNAYYDVKPRFCSEFGYQSFPSQETVETFCPPDQRNVFSPVMDHHQKCNLGNAPIIGMFGKYFRMPESFGDFLYLSQAQQALAIKTGVEYWRTLKPRCMGTLFWQLNDNWPVASWASIEYGGKWKQLQSHAKRFYAPVIAVVIRDKAGTVRLHAVSDVTSKLAVAVEASLLRFDGSEVKRFKIESTLKPGESKVLKVFRDKEFDGVPGTECFLETRCRAVAPDGRVFEHENTFFFEPFKRCPLEKAAVKAEVTEREGALYIRLTGDRPAFFVTLDAPGVPGLFSDNSLTLLPGEPREVRFTPRGGCDAKKLKAALTVRTLRDTYR